MDENNLNEWMHSTGFLFPRNEKELARFNELYADYDFKLKDASIDLSKIINGELNEKSVVSKMETTTRGRVLKSHD